jgi:hypothetical protein
MVERFFLYRVASESPNVTLGALKRTLLDEAHPADSLVSLANSTAVATGEALDAAVGQALCKHRS